VLGACGGGVIVGALVETLVVRCCFVASFAWVVCFLINLLYVVVRYFFYTNYMPDKFLIGYFLNKKYIATLCSCQNF
jgi:uncharacterized membrane protein